MLSKNWCCTFCTHYNEDPEYWFYDELIYILLKWILVYYSSTTSDSDNVEAAAAAQPRSQRRFVFAKKSSQKDFQCKEWWNDPKKW